jgi:hypothetical protein
VRVTSRTRISNALRVTRWLCFTGICALAAVTINYGVRQVQSEHRLVHMASKILADAGAANADDLASIISIAHKQSRYWTGAVGRHHEAGVVQLSEELALSSGLRIERAQPKSTPLAKLTFADVPQGLVQRDRRFDNAASLRVAISCFLQTQRSLAANYGLEKSAARDIAVLAVLLGDKQVRSMLD